MNKRLMVSFFIVLSLYATGATVLYQNNKHVAAYRRGDYNYDGVTDARDMSLYLVAWKDHAK